MTINFSVLLSFFPFVLFIYLLLWKKLSLSKVSLITFTIILITLIFYWQMSPLFIGNSILKGILVALDILIIIFGALFFLEVTKDLEIINNLSHFLKTYFKDYRVQVIFLAWFFSNFIEGTAGFGTPAAIVVPVLIGLGLSPLTAVVISLLGNSASGVFGAAGTPIRTGYAGLNVGGVAEYAVILNIIGFFVPIFMIWTLSRLQKNKNEHFFEALPFAIWSGLAFVLPSCLIVSMGQEFPTIFGSIIGLIIVLATTRMGWFLPKTPRHLTNIEELKIKLPRHKLILPYFLLISFLIIGKFTLGSVMIDFPWGFKYSLNLFNPGIAFILSGIIISFLWGKNELTKRKITFAFKKAIEPFIIIALMSAVAQLMINSNNNLTHTPSMLDLIAKVFETNYLAFFAPFIGAFGAFITGSITVSNIMFGHLFETASKNLHLNSSLVLASGLVGAAAGNMIALADLLVAETVSGLQNKTKEILKGVIVPCLIYLFLIGIFASFLM